jgi:hypothetical protein
MPVNLDGLVIEQVEAERVSTAGGVRLRVRGSVRNASSTERPLPSLVAIVTDIARAPVARQGFAPPAPSLAAGGAAPFQLDLADAPGAAAEVAVRFHRTSERAAPGRPAGPAS